MVPFSILFEGHIRPGQRKACGIETQTKIWCIKMCDFTVRLHILR